MRLGWHVRLFGPFGIGGTIWRSKRRRRGYHGTLPGGWKCPHNHSRLDLAVACAEREARRRAPAGHGSPEVAEIRQGVAGLRQSVAETIAGGNLAELAQVRGAMEALAARIRAEQPGLADITRELDGLIMYVAGAETALAAGISHELVAIERELDAIEHELPDAPRWPWTAPWGGHPAG